MNAAVGEHPGVKADRLAAVASAILASTGVPEADARVAADSLVDADLRGIHSHGVSRLGIYVERLRMGGNRPVGEPELVSDSPSLALLDANDLLAQVASARAVRLAAHKAAATGCGVVCVRGASHFGAAGYWARLIAEQGMLGMASTNTTPVMAAWGGSTTAIGSNPIAMAFPSSDAAPVVVDMATSETTWGALLRAEATGAPIPETWALGPDGRPTTSAGEAVAAGRLLPFGRHKGYALAVGVELLTGALAGANCLSQVAHLYMEPEKPMGAGLFFLAVDPSVVYDDDGQRFPQKVHEVQRALNALPSSDAGGRVLWPGQLEAERAGRGRTEGVPLAPMIVAEVRKLARGLGVPESLLAALGEEARPSVDQEVQVIRSHNPATARPAVALLGTGTMGAPMARNLARAGLAVTAWNRTPAKAEALVADGVRTAAAPAAGVGEADVLVTMLADGAATEAVVSGPDGALAALPPGAIWIQMSTVGVPAANRLAALAADHRIGFVDAPVLGSYEPAERGELIILASGPDELRDRCAPIFDAVGARASWLGPAGLGSRLKVVVNAWLMSTTAALGETIALAERLEVDPALFLDVTDRGAVGALYTDMNGPTMAERTFPLNFPLEHATKDAALALEAAGETIDLRVFEATHAQFARAEELGHGRSDWAAVICAAAGEPHV